ncbi:MAG TPA: VWA domain-containing protein, partial [Kofleriaceae bacterium]|nr:VWA domain-containing protein [Kofleriaceae bacterium]
CPNPVRLGIRVALSDSQVREVASSLHAVTTAMRDAQVIELQPHERLDRDFVLRWRVDGDELRSQLVCSDDPDGKAGTFMLTFVPPSTLAVSQKPRDVVFVIDRSGSMQGWKMQAARRATARMIDTLTSRDRFFVIAFDNTVEVLPDARPAYATDRMRYKAVEELSKIEARGGTELELPLTLAVKQLAGGHDDRERVIVLVTDGQVGNEDHILRQVAPNLRNVRMFTLGIDQAVNAAFLRRLAGAGGGLCELVESEDRLDAVMAKVHRRISTPVATDLRLEAHGMDVHWSSVAPTKLPDVYAGAPVVVLGRYRGTAPSDASLSVDGTSFGDPMKLRITRDAGSTQAPIGASWARAYIRDLEDKYATGQRSLDAGQRSLDAEIVGVSKQWSVLSRFTAFLAVDRSTVVNPGGRLVQAVQPVESPAGWEGQAQSVTRAGSVSSNYASPPRPAPAGMRSATALRGAPMGGAPMGSGGGAGFDRSRTLAGAPRPAESAPAPTPPALARPRPAPGMMPPASPPPPPAGASSHAPVPMSPKQEAAPPADASAYLAKLATLARDLETEARGAASLGKLRIVRQRLREWVEDLRSVGGFASLADAVDQLAQKLGEVIATGTDLATQALNIAAQLATIAAGSPVPPRSSGRPAFWK